MPHFYLHTDVDMSAVERLRDRLRTGGEPVPSITAAVVYACAQVIRDDPSLNVFYDGDGLVHRDRVSIGVAVATDAGLLVPIVTDAGTRALSEVAREVRAAAERARSGRLQDGTPQRRAWSSAASACTASTASSRSSTSRIR